MALPEIITWPGRLGSEHRADHVALHKRFNVASYDLIADGGCVGDGVADDTTAFAAAITAAGGTLQLTSQPGKTYLVDSPQTISAASAALDLKGSTFKKKSTWSGSGNALIISGANVTVKNLIVDGNRAAGPGGGGIHTTGANCRLENVRVTATKQNAFVTTAGDLTCIDCQASSIDDGSGTSGSANGFNAVGGLLRTNAGCRATSCARAGFIVSNAGDHEINGETSLCGIGMQILTDADGGRIGRMVCDDSSTFGLSATRADKWRVGHFEATDTAATSLEPSGTAGQLLGCLDWEIDTFVCRGVPGYGLAFAANAGTKCDRIHVGVLHSDGSPSFDSDPGLLLGGGSKRVTIDTAYIRGHTVAVSFGETAELDTYDNAIGYLFATGCSHGVVLVGAGGHNHIGRIVARDCGTEDGAVMYGLVSFKSANAFDNTVGFIDARNSGTTHTGVPNYVVWADATATENHVLDGFGRDDIRSPARDQNGSNQFLLRARTIQTTLATLDSGEAWTSVGGGAVTDNTTGGQFVEGTGGKKLAAHASTTTAELILGAAVDLSGMAAEDWFRVHAYAAAVSGAPINLRFLTDTSNYYAIGSSGIGHSGAQYLHFRKGEAAATGSPNWANITRIRINVADTANDWTFDQIARLYSNRFAATPTSGGV